MRLRYVMVLAAVGIFAASASATVIMNSTEVFPKPHPSANWGNYAVGQNPMVGWTSAKASWGQFAVSFGQANIASHTDDGSGVLRNKTTGGGSGVNVIQFTSTPGMDYTLTGYVQRDVVTGTWTEYQLVDGSNWANWDVGGFCDVITVPTVNTWVQFGKTVKATGTVMTILLKAGYTPGGSGAPNAYWDDISIVETPEPTAALLLLLPMLFLRRRRT